jgi:NADH-quinone oxidoreductase subunit E
MLREKYPDEIQKILAKYPDDQKRSAVMPLLYLAQREGGFVTKGALEEIAAVCEIQVCTDLPCALRGAEEFLQKLCDNLGIKVGETTPDGKITVEAVMCLAGCHRAPMFQVQSGEGLEYHENQSVESAMQVIEALKAKEE